MSLRHRSCLFSVVTLAGLLTHTCEAQRPTKLPGGFAVSTGAPVTVAEVLKQPDLWVMDVQFKPMRMLRIDVTDPKTGTQTKELIWYLVWRAENRILNVQQEIRNRATAANNVPVNPSEPQLGFVVPGKMFVPEITLVTNDGGNQSIYPDTVLPEIQAAIELRERIRLSNGQPTRLRNAVEASGPVPAAVPAEDGDGKAIYGVAIWRKIDPNTDYFSIFMNGFSNGYRIVRGPDNELLIARKTIVQDFWRPGDPFEQDEREFRFQGEPRWIYRLEAGDIGIPKVDEVLGVASEDGDDAGADGPEGG